MAYGGIASDKNDLLKRLAEAALLQQPKQAFHRDIDDALFSLLAGGAMNDVRDALHGGTHDFAVGDASAHNLQMLLRFKTAVVTECANRDVFGVDVVEHAANEKIGRAHV